MTAGHRGQAGLDQLVDLGARTGPSTRSFASRMALLTMFTVNSSRPGDVADGVLGRVVVMVLDA